MSCCSKMYLLLHQGFASVCCSNLQLMGSQPTTPLTPPSQQATYSPPTPPALGTGYFNPSSPPAPYTPQAAAHSSMFYGGGGGRPPLPYPGASTTSPQAFGCYGGSPQRPPLPDVQSVLAASPVTPTAGGAFSPHARLFQPSTVAITAIAPAQPPPPPAAQQTLAAAPPPQSGDASGGTPTDPHAVPSPAMTCGSVDEANHLLV